MQIFDPWTYERAARLPLDESTVRFVLASILKSLLIHLGLGVAVTLGVNWIFVSSSGPAAMFFGVVQLFCFFYVIFGLVALYAHLKTRKYIIRQFPYYQDKENGAEILWGMHRDVFPPRWGGRPELDTSLRTERSCRYKSAPNFPCKGRYRLCRKS